MQKKNSGSKQSRDIWANMEYLAYDEVKGHGNKVNNNKRKNRSLIREWVNSSNNN
jgi:hypothetical protein